MSITGILPVHETEVWQGQDGPATHGQDAHVTCRIVSKTCPLFFSLILLLTSAGLSAQPAARKLLPETALLDRADGKLLHVDANEGPQTQNDAFGNPGTWLFELTMEVKTPDYRLAAGTRFVLLPSATLGRLVVDVNDRVAPRYRLSARVTLYRGKNYLFPFYYLPLSKFKDNESPEEGEQKPEPGKPNPQSEIMSPSASTGGRNPKSNEPELAIPPEILEKLKKQRPLRGPRRGAEAQRKPIPESPEQVLVDCVGRIEDGRVGSYPTRPPDSRAQNAWVKNPPYVFAPYALGWNVGDVRYELLPCAALEEALGRQKGALDPIRFNVAGLVTEFQGRKYFLLQRAIVVYNYGNFGR